jgi:hypothetical protein
MLKIHHKEFATWDEVVQWAFDEYKVIVDDDVPPPATQEEMEMACAQLEHFLRL